jgi:hypothetical protein
MGTGESILDQAAHILFSEASWSMNHTPMSICLIVDSETITKWEFEALEIVLKRNQAKIGSVLFCVNSNRKRKLTRYPFYYLLNIFSMRNVWTKRRHWKVLIDAGTPVLPFESLSSRGWQSIPVETLANLESIKPDVILKFGMNLLKDPDQIPSKFGVLSFHHGDPTKFRGRPAGFYELLQNQSTIGVIVQRICNSLDAGEIYASGSFRCTSHSYKKTLENAYGNGRYLLSKALSNIESPIKPQIVGPLYTIPNNRTTLKFVFFLLTRKINWLLNSAFTQKRWMVSTSPISPEVFFENYDLLAGRREIPIPTDVNFIADPFILSDGTIICEMTKKSSITGQLAIIREDRIEAIQSGSHLSGKHTSFPFPFENDGSHFLLPEMASVGSQSVFRIGPNHDLTFVQTLLGLEGERLIDPVLIFKDDTWWLFAGRLGSESDLLFLWTSNSLMNEFKEHQASPIVANSNFARNGGAIYYHNGNHYRIAQDGTGKYGDGISVMLINQLSHSIYEEELVTRIKFPNMFGPHTLNFDAKRLVYDHYGEKFNLLSWLIKLGLKKH